MQGVRFKVITGNDPDIFQERLNRFVESLPEDVVLVEGSCKDLCVSVCV
jgi:hypothetical protein